MSYIPAELIKKKRNGEEHSPQELQFLVDSFVNDSIPTYQMSAWVMAVYFQGMTEKETAVFTALMRDSGEKVSFQNESIIPVDKHSTGGVGDKTSIILTPLAAAMGLSVPMIAGRGLGHTGGTLDKLESIPGFSVNLTIEQFKKNVVDHGFCLIGQTDEICPADKKLYALRDVTATIDSYPLICGSIMSKKLAEGVQGLVLDVKYGSGAFMKTSKDAVELAKMLKSIGLHNDVEVTALITNMQQPLGRFIGNALEINECIDIMQGRNKPYYNETAELTLHLASHMAVLANKFDNPAEAYKAAEKTLNSGQAYNKFEQLCQIQGQANLSQIPTAKHKWTVESKESGFINSFNTEEVGLASLMLGAGRFKSEDSIDYTAGLEVHKKIGEAVKEGEDLFTCYSDRFQSHDEVDHMLLESIDISTNKIEPEPMIHTVI